MNYIIKIILPLFNTCTCLVYALYIKGHVTIYKSHVVINLYIFEVYLSTSIELDTEYKEYQA